LQYAISFDNRELKLGGGGPTPAAMVMNLAEVIAWLRKEME